MYIATKGRQYGCEILLINANSKEEAAQILKESVDDRYWGIDELVWGDARAYDDPRIAEVCDLN